VRLFVFGERFLALPRRKTGLFLEFFCERTGQAMQTRGEGVYGRPVRSSQLALSSIDNSDTGRFTMLAATEQVCWVPISDIMGWQESEEAFLCADGVLRSDDGATVLVSLREDGGYQLLAGRERLEELKALGQTCVDAVICPSWNLDERISTLLNRLLSGDLHYLDEAEEYRRILDSGVITKQELAQRLGRSPAAIQKKLRLLTLGEEPQSELRARGLCERYAQALLRIPGEQGRARMAVHIGERALSVKEAVDLIEEMMGRMPIAVPKERKMIPLMRDHRVYVNAIRGIVEQMRDAGVDATMQVGTGQAVVEVRVTVPKAKQIRNSEFGMRS